MIKGLTRQTKLRANCLKKANFLIGTQVFLKQFSTCKQINIKNNEQGHSK